MYKPLPKEITIKESNIQGLGLFATEDIKEGHDFGTSHITNAMFENGHIRTPLGGFINHSEKPNCKLVKPIPRLKRTDFPNVFKNGVCLRLVAIRDIKKDEELTTKYTLYEFGEKYDK